MSYRFPKLADMTDAQTAALPDEDRLDPPRPWRRHIRPKRGDGRPPAIELVSESVEDRIAERDLWLRQRLDIPRNAEYRSHALAFLDGEADPLGAAAVATLMRQVEYRFETTVRPMVDLLVAEHGLPFAACFAVEHAALALTYHYAPNLADRAAIVRLTPDDLEWSTNRDRGGLDRVRTLLLAASDDEYEATVAALGRHRDTPLNRLSASLEAPEERAWIDEICAEHRGLACSGKFSAALVELITTPEQLKASGVAGTVRLEPSTSEVADLLARLGVHAFPLLSGSLDARLSAAGEHLLLKAIALTPTDEAMALLLDRLGKPRTMAHALEAAARFPRRALRLIAATAADASAERRGLLAALVQSDPVLLDAALPSLDAGAQDAIASLVDVRGRVPFARKESLPVPLADPPWKRGGKAGREAAVVAGLTPPETKRVVWAEGEVALLGSLQGRGRRRLDPTGFGVGFDYTRFFSDAPIAVAEEHLDRWNGEYTYVSDVELKRILARFGDRAVDQVTRVAASKAAVREALVPVFSVDAARLAADWLVRLEISRPNAIAWLDRHADDAATLLVPDALGKAGKARTAARAALRHLIVEHGPERVRAAAARYGLEAAAAIEELTDADPLDPVGKKIPVTAALFSPGLLPQVLLKGREEALPPEAVENLVTVLAIATPDYPYSGVDVLAEHCDRESLARFSWAVFEHWIRLGAPTEHSWALTQLRHFADDEIVRGLTSRIRVWPGEGQHKRAITGLEVLGAIGSEAALRAVHGISEKVKFEALKEKASTQIRAVAEELGLSTEQLADRLVPDFGLGEASALLIDYGPRHFTVGFDERLQPFVVDDKGKRRKSLPKPDAKDDEELAQTGRKRFSRLKKELRTVSAEQVRRMERAMVAGRTWSAEEFRRYFVEHPLMWHLARRLLWTAESGGERTAFRLAEDRSWADVDEDDLTPPGGARIRLAHPVLLGSRIKEWTEIFADYEILQPFDQLARPVMAFTEEEVATGRLARFEGRAVSTGALMGLANKGWDRPGTWEGGWEIGMYYRLPGAVRLSIDLAAGAGDSTWNVNEVRLERHGKREGAAASKIDPVPASEILSGLAKATGTG